MFRLAGCGWSEGDLAVISGRAGGAYIPDVSADWYVIGGDETALADAVKGFELPQGAGRIWVSCEASIMREIRRHCIEERGLDRSMLRTQGYWKAGASNHPDHDMGDDV